MTTPINDKTAKYNLPKGMKFMNMENALTSPQKRVLYDGILNGKCYDQDFLKKNKDKKKEVGLMIQKDHEDTLHAFDVEVEDGPGLSCIDIVQLAALVGNVEYLQVAFEYLGAASKDIHASLFCIKKQHDQEEKKKKSENDPGRTLTEFACRSSRSKEVIKFLHSKGIFNHETPNNHGVYPIFILCQEGHIDALKYAHEECGMSLTTKHKEDGYNGFIIAIRFEQFEIAKYFLEKVKESQNTNNENNKNKDLKDAVIDYQLTVKTSKGVIVGKESPFTLACSLGRSNLDLIRLLWQHGCHLQPLHEAQEHTRPMKILRCEDEDDANEAAGKDPSKVFRKFKHFPVIPQSAIPASMMMQEVNGGDNNKSKTTTKTDDPPKLGKVLSSYKLSVGGERSECNSPVHAAVRACDLPVLKFLLDTAGFDFDKDSVVGLRTPLDIACRNGFNGIVHYLVQEKRCDVNKRSKDENFPLYIASYLGNTDLVKLLLQSGANSTFLWEGSTAFFAAVSQSKIETARVLFDGKADVSTHFKERSPTQYARERGLTEMVAFLEERRVY